MEIGLKLKEARELKGLSLDDLQETTKIQKRYLKAIEEGNLSILPGKFYARAFIKEYATAVGLNAEDLLQEYEAEIPKVEEEVTTQYTRIKQSKGDGSSINSSALFSLVPTLTVIFLIVGIMFAAWWFYQKTSTTNNADPIDKNNDNEIVRNQPDEDVPDAVVDDADADEKKAEEKAEAEAKKEAKATEDAENAEQVKQAAKDKKVAEAEQAEKLEQEKKAKAEKEAKQDKAEKKPEKKPGKVENKDKDKKDQPAKKAPKKEKKKEVKEEKLDTTVAILGTGSSPQSTIDVNNLTPDVKVTLESTGNTWLEVKNSAGKSLYSNTFSTENSPEEIDVTNEERVYFVIGNAPDLKIKINGKELEYPIDPGQKVFQKIWLNLNKAAQ